MTEIVDKVKQREQWVSLLHAGWMFHQQMVKETTSPVIGAKDSKDTIFHKALSVAIQDAMNLIQQMEAYGYFDESDDDEELSKPGLMG